jgi:Fusaric acid resistance protein-like
MGSDGEGTKHNAHLAAALRWSAGADADWAQMAAASLGMAVPIAAGIVAGHAESGFAASIGGLMLGGVGSCASAREQLREIALAIAPAIAATLAAAALAGHGFESAIVVVLIGAACLLGGFSRPTAVAATRFSLFLLVLVAAMAGASMQPWRVALLAALGICWSALMSLLCGAFARAKKSPDGDAPSTTYTTAQRFAHWRRSLRGFAGWQYALRISLCLAAAMMLRSRWPAHHLHWVAITVVLLAERQLGASAVKITQRGAGTLAGVLVAGLLAEWNAGAWAIAAAVAVLAGLRPLLRVRNYLAYTAVTTPLILALLDAGQPQEPGILVDRLMATLAGAALVLAANALFRASPREGGHSP